MSRPVTPPTPEKVGETAAALDRLDVPIEATRAQAGRALRAAGIGVSTPRLAAALVKRKAAAGLTPRNARIATAPSAEALAETAADLDRLEVPVHATGTQARAALVKAGLTVGRPRVDRAQSTRRAREGMTEAQAQRARDVKSVLVGLYDPRLIGAACTGKAPLWDDEVPGERLEDRLTRLSEAHSVCRRCAVAAACHTAAAEHRSAGLWAGRLQASR